ncbi:receptor activity-modifying protein 1-like [Takifugu flavidus]|uniref:Receptor activity-modifying protein 1 n=2 Tax=Takifugu TaxID=31032 RepID=A0A5C6PNE2_9TELE|nr:receptor activity-modifying protein 1-like [Takifugu flavidus]TNN04456.1 hypothetical protein fugu_001485 [Takifugu bimaculatus]TWW80469.1 hypothetical protein D4764_01G0002840 [Takifugu flavidus]
MLLTALLGILLTCSGTAVKLTIPPCDQHMFDSQVEDCLFGFNTSLETSDRQEGCPWPAVKHKYHKLKLCVDNLAIESWCKGHGFLVDDFFLKVHNMYFSGCGRIRDPPLSILVLLIGPMTFLTLLLPHLCVFLTTKDTEMPGSLGL